jgi:hypothetical protein
MNKIVKIQKIGVVSAAKIYGIILTAIGFFIGVIIGVISLLGGLMGAPMMGGGPGMMGPFMFIFLPIMYGTLGFVIGGAIALIYNLVAKKLGGLEVIVDNIDASGTENS